MKRTKQNLSKTGITSGVDLGYTYKNNGSVSANVM